MDQNLNEFLSEVCIPKLTELLVLFVFLDECGFGMLLNES